MSERGKWMFGLLVACVLSLLIGWNEGKHAADRWWQAHQTTVTHLYPGNHQGHILRVCPDTVHCTDYSVLPRCQEWDNSCGFKPGDWVDSDNTYCYDANGKPCEGFGIIGITVESGTRPCKKDENPFDIDCKLPKGSGDSAGVPIGSQPYTIKQGDCVRINSNGTTQKVYKIPCWDDSESTYCHEKFDPKCKLLTDHGPVPKP